MKPPKTKKEPSKNFVGCKKSLKISAIRAKHTLAKTELDPS